MRRQAPSVMISSTYYDLRQIRADLGRFLEDELNYRALLSEYSSFPIEPDLNTIENCRRRVEQDADIFVLVIGGRYGYVDPSTSKSITNLEYLAARAKGIPIYAFVEKGVLALLPLWERNPDADFSHAIGDIRVFQFINHIRGVDRVWMHEFELAQEIISTLRVQFSYLLNEGLQYRLRLGSATDPVLPSLHGKALRLVLERPDAWEYKLFAQVLADEIETSSELRLEHRLGLVLGTADHVEKEASPAWMRARINELEKTANALTDLLNDHLQVALGPPGVAGDAASITFIARKIGAIYRQSLEWSLRIRRADVHDCFRLVAKELSLFTDNMIERTEAFGPDLLRQIDEALSAPMESGPRELEATLKIDISNLDGFSAALAKAERDCFR